MLKKASSFDDFLVATILADLFDPSGSDDFDFVSRKIVDGLDAQGMIKSHYFDNEEGLAA
ncbi:hypothetical protein [Prochlorococcus marinus]|uniref:hypothetical protein n=1 Tax=Prochlorococcus marinus TaxID=1219 RepID=UPI001ADBB996|nr:hypothetical protein [Prochlorococcus marinus]MBO8204842.1 hypothetical protein [Prochlorococcus marinus CUG1415]MBW3044115.1 hypothetical protein [Prochlorococcus marinus str. MU1415]